MESKVDERTRKYFDAIKFNVGFIGSNYSESDGITEILQKTGVTDIPKLIKTYNGYLNSSSIEIFKYSVNNNIRYCAELSYQNDIDSFCVETHIFNRYPSRDDVIAIRDIYKTEFGIDYRGYQQEFECWECGHHVHWLDTKGTLSQKIDNMKEKFCTMCDSF